MEKVFMRVPPRVEGLGFESYAQVLKDHGFPSASKDGAQRRTSVVPCGAEGFRGRTDECEKDDGDPNPLAQEGSEWMPS